MRALSLLVCSIALACSVESGPIPQLRPYASSAVYEKTRSQVREALSELHASAGLVNRVQAVLRRGMAERHIETGKTALPLNLLRPSEDDLLWFDSVHPERFSYQLGNSASFNLRTRSGGNVEVCLQGVLDTTGSYPTIKDAKLFVIYRHDSEQRTFKILFERTSEVDGEARTTWSIDFHELGELHRAMGGTDEAMAKLSGSLEVHFSTNETFVSGKDFHLAFGSTTLAFEEIDIRLGRKSAATSGNRIVVKGKIFQGDVEYGVFSLNKKTGSRPEDIAFSIDVH